MHVADHAKGYDAGRPESGLGQGGHGSGLPEDLFLFSGRESRKCVVHLRAPKYGKQFENEFLIKINDFM